MSRKAFLAEITPRDRSRYLDKLFLSKNLYKDGLNGCPTEFQMFIPIPDETHPPNIQLWIKNGGGKVLIRFSDPTELATTLRKLADIVTTNLCLDEFQHAEDMASS